jgi:hypothetical protein
MKVRLDEFAPSLTPLAGGPGNAILLNGAPGFQSQIPASTSEFRFMNLLSSLLVARLL